MVTVSMSSPPKDAALSRAGAFTLLFAACLTIMVGCVIVPGLLPIAAALGVSHASGWLVTVPSLGVVVFAPVVGAVMHRSGPRPVLLGGLVAYGALGLGGMFLHGFVWVMLDRLLLGAATAAVMASGTALLSAFYSGHARLVMIARQGMAIELGGVLFLAVGGQLAMMGWRWPFLLYLVAWAIALMALRWVPSPPTPLADSSAVEPADQAPATGAGDVYAAALLSMLLFFTGVIQLPARLSALDFNEARIGFFLSGVSLVAVAAASMLPRVARAIGGLSTLCIAFGSYAVAHAVFAMASGPVPMLAGGALMGVGFGLSIPLVNHLIVERSSAHQRSHRLALLSSAIFSGQFLATFSQWLPTSTAAMAVAAVMAAASCLGFLLWRHKSRHGVTG